MCRTADERQGESRTLPLQPLPLEEAVVVHAVKVVGEWRHAQVVVDQPGEGQETEKPAGHMHGQHLFTWVPHAGEDWPGTVRLITG